MVGVRPIPATRTFTISMGLASKTCPYSTRCCSWKRRNRSSASAGPIGPVGNGTRSS